MSPSSVVHHLRSLSEGGGQGKRDPVLPLYSFVKVKSYWKNKKRLREMKAHSQGQRRAGQTQHTISPSAKC